nr:MAG TPA: hypothetical protein [Caudoviricetes sp.]
MYEYIPNGAFTSAFLLFSFPFSADCFFVLLNVEY